MQVGFAGLNAMTYERHPVLAEMVVQAHLSCGALVFGLTVSRLVWRFSTPTPSMPRMMGLAAQRTALAVHAALYALLLVLPVSGYVKLAALGFEAELFGFLPLPALPFDAVLAARAHSLHGWASVLLGCLLACHVGAALFHRRLFGQPVLGRMFPPRATPSRQVAT